MYQRVALQYKTVSNTQLSGIKWQQRIQCVVRKGCLPYMAMYESNFYLYL